MNVQIELEEHFSAAERELRKEMNQGRLDNLADKMISLLLGAEKDPGVCRRLTRLIEKKGSGCLMLEALMLSLVNKTEEQRKAIASMVEVGARPIRKSAAKEYANALLNPEPHPRRLVTDSHGVLTEVARVEGPVHYRWAA